MKFLRGLLRAEWLFALVFCPPLAIRGADFTAEDFRRTKLEAEKGDLEAQVDLGVMYFSGEGIPQNYGEALKWYRRAADKGNAAAQNNLASMYLKGHGVPRNPIEGAKWMQSAAKQGLPKAQLNMGALYADGIGVGRNALEAVRWIRRAADQGDAEGQRILGHVFEEGRLARADSVEAYKWFVLASAQGDDEAQEARDLIATSLTDKQIAEGQRRASAFVPRPEPGRTMEPKATGSGFFVTRDGYFVTCQHVVDSAARIVIKTKHLRLAAEVVKTDRTNDLALLKVTGALPRSPATNDTVALRALAAQTAKMPNVNRTNLLKVAGKFLPLAVTDSSAVKLGQPVSTLGFPNIHVQGLEPKLTRGEINSLTGIKDNPRYFQMSAAVQPGNSGGPLFDRLGNVIGIVALRLNDLTSLRRTGAVPQNVNYAVKSCHLVELLESLAEVKNSLKSPQAAGEEGSAEDWITGAQESVAVVQVF